MFEPHQKRAYVREMFARIAPRYDLLNRLMTFGMDQRWRVRAARLAVGENPAPFALDLATGTGDFAIAIQSVAPRARVVGLDLVYEMLAYAQAKNAARGGRHEALPLLAGDALDLPFPENTFDAVTSAFMLRNVVSLERAFAEMARVAKPGARIVALEITQPRLPLWSALYKFYFYRLVPRLGGALSDRDAYRYLPASAARFVNAEELAHIMRGAGLTNVHYEWLNLGTVAIHVGSKAITAPHP
jgi:demethylmenaquinone methyltransferase/2-methoxy-6-polyprenyl-1,4-benzoquinol methylase